MGIETLHQLCLGLMRHALEMLVEMVKDHGKAEAVTMLGRGLEAMPGLRQSERTAFPRASFTAEALNLAKMTGQEVPALLLQTAAVLAGDRRAKLLSRQDAGRVVHALELLYRVRTLVEGEELLFNYVVNDDGLQAEIKRLVGGRDRQNGRGGVARHPAAPVTASQAGTSNQPPILCVGLFAFLIRAMVAYKAAFQGYDKTDFGFTNFHKMLHYRELIECLGSLVPISGYGWEGAIKTVAKEPYRAIGGQHLHLEARLLRRSLMRSSLVHVMSLYEDEDVVRSMLLYGIGDHDWCGMRPSVKDGIDGGEEGRARARRTARSWRPLQLWKPVAGGEPGEVEATLEASGKPYQPTRLPQQALDLVSGWVAGCV